MVDDAHSTRVLVSIAGVVGFALLTAVGARVVIPLPGTPVPITLQTVFVLLAGVTLGPRLGVASMALYLLLGATGYHVFALGHWGLHTVVGATGGYLVGFLLAQPAIGSLTRPDQASWRRLALAAVAGNVIIFTVGLAWLWLWLGTTPSNALALGLWPFVPGMAVKLAIVLVAGMPLMKLAHRWFGTQGA